MRGLCNVAGEFAATGTDFLHGPPRMWAEQLAELTLTQGTSSYFRYLVDDPDTIRRFAAEVAPAARELVAAERANAA